jgi:3-oxoacyl-[acyl-carrier protein] reductase
MANKLVALVTGASQGIGRATAVRLAKAGYSIAVNYYQSEDDAKITCQQIQKMGIDCKCYGADVGSLKEVQEMMEHIVADFNKLDALICNAGIYTRSNLNDLTPSKWARTLEVNLTGAYNCTYTARPQIENAGADGRIVYITSQLAYRGTAQGAHYSATKAALTGLMKSIAIALAPYQVTVNAVSPGFVDTQLIAGDNIEKRQEREREVPLGRIGDPEDIANAVAFLCSSKARYITGETIHANGGLLMY